MQNFQQEVIERSYQKPVLVDFWASWCGPCRVLGPVLEQLAEEQQDRWELVKVNTEEHQELAQQYQIMSIPNVKLFHNGEVVNEFAGALPKHQIKEWLDANIPDASVSELHTLLAGAGGRSKEETEQALKDFIATNPENLEARLALAQFIVFDRPEEVAPLVDTIHPTDPMFERANDLLQLARLMQLEPSNGSPAGTYLYEARKSLAENNYEAAIQKIIQATIADKHYMEDLPRLAAISLFHIWGNEHELTKEYRRQFDMALY